MHEFELLKDLAIVMTVAGVVTILFHRLRLPVILGYLHAGVLIGPHFPSILAVHNKETIKILGELGVIFLMFSLGQNFRMRKLVEVGTTAIIAGIVECCFMIWLGFQVGKGFGWSHMDGLFMGCILAISSSTIIAKTLRDLGKDREQFADLVFGILIIEDIIAIAMIALLSGLANTGVINVKEVGLILGQLTIFLTMLVVAGVFIVPRLLHYIAQYRSDEMLLITALGLCFGISLIALQLGYSVALGAFLAGALVSEAKENHKVEVLIEPIRDMFSAVFFVAIGMLLDPEMLLNNALPTFAATVVFILGKMLMPSLGVFLAGGAPDTALKVGIGLAQMGEFSFIIAQLGVDLKATSGFLYQIAVAVAVITVLINPYLIKGSDGLIKLLERSSPQMIRSFISTYHQWVVRLGSSVEGQRNQVIRKIVLKIILQLSLDLILVTGLLIVAKGIVLQWFPGIEWLPSWIGGSRTIIWTATITLSLPIQVHMFVKLRAFSLILAELGIPSFISKEQLPKIRTVFAAVIFTIISGILTLWFLLVGMSLLPPWPVLLVLGSIFAITVTLLWRHFCKVYARVQFSIRDTLSQPLPTRNYQRPLSTLLKNAELRFVRIKKNSTADGHLISEIALRRITGASIVGIERNGVDIVNPGPDEELREGDTILLLGKRAHIDIAKKYLSE
ncbi:cation:proton antiporter [Deltaproteobacteria bacterium TL4]